MSLRIFILTKLNHRWLIIFNSEQRLDTLLALKASFPCSLPASSCHAPKLGNAQESSVVQHEEEKRAHNSCSLQVPWAGAEMAGNGGCKLGALEKERH